MAFGAFVERGAAQCHALVDGATVANFCRLAHHHAHRVIEKHALANLGTRVNLNTREKACDVRHKAAQPFEPVIPKPMGTAVKHQCMQAGVAGERLPCVARSWVAVKNGMYVDFKT